MCPVLRKYYLPPLTGQWRNYNCKTRMGPSCLLPGGRFFADPEPERGGLWLPRTGTPVPRFIWCLGPECRHSANRLLLWASPLPRTQLPAPSFVLPQWHSHCVLGLAGCRPLSKVLNSGYDRGLWDQTELGLRVTLTKLLNLSKPQFLHLLNGSSKHPSEGCCSDEIYFKGLAPASQQGTFNKRQLYCGGTVFDDWTFGQAAWRF